MRLFDRIIPARRSLRNYILLILVVTLATLAYFLFPQVRSAAPAIVDAFQTFDRIVVWLVLGTTAVMLLLAVLLKLVTVVLLARLKRDKLRRGVDGETLDVPTDARPGPRP